MISLSVLGLLVIAVVIAGIAAFSTGEDSSDPVKDTEPRIEEEQNEFSGLYYYEKEKLDRYENYQSANPDIDPADIVWMVNSGLDGVHYTDAVPIKKPGEQLVLVNKYNSLPEDYEPDDLVDIDGSKTAGKATVDAFMIMQAAAAEEGVEFHVYSGYRSYDTQATFYNSSMSADPENADTYIARPGFSEHQTGMALDLITNNNTGLTTFSGTEAAAWVAANAHKYGFIVRYTEENTIITGYMSEPWHVRYIGVEHSMKMHDEGMSSYEEYKVKFIDHSPKD